MTRSEVTEFKKALIGRYTSYYSKANESLSVRVYSYINNSYDPETEDKAVKEFKELIKDKSYKTEIKHRTYQGFIHDTCVIVK